MRQKILDLREARNVVATWIEDVSVSELALPEFLKSELLDQLARALPLADREGSVWFEVPGLASLGMGIFRHSFHLGDTVIYVAPYAPTGLVLLPAEPAVAQSVSPPVPSDGLGTGRGVPFGKLASSRSGPL